MSEQKPIILVAEDEPELREAWIDCIQELGAEALEAENGLEALEKIKSQDFDVILSDIQMPKMSGLELLQGLRNLGKDTPFVICTAYGDQAGTLTALRLGAFDFIEKPVSRSDLQKILKDAIELSQYLKKMNADLTELLTGPNGLDGEEAKRIEALMRVRIANSIELKKRSA